jgi:hypothetical protein
MPDWGRLAVFLFAQLLEAGCMPAAPYCGNPPVIPRFPLGGRFAQSLPFDKLRASPFDKLRASRFRLFRSLALGALSNVTYRFFG